MAAYIAFGWLLAAGQSLAGAEPVLAEKTLQLKELAMPFFSLGLGVGTDLLGAAGLATYLASGGRHINVKSNSPWHELQDVQAAVKEAGLRWAELFVTARIVPEDLGYDGTVMAVDRMMGWLGLERLNLVLVGPGRYRLGSRRVLQEDPACAHSDFGWELCIAGSIAAAEHMQALGTVQALGAYDWSVHWLQRFWPILQAPLAAMLLTMDTLAGSHRAAMKYCLMRGVQVILGGFVEQPGRLLLYMYFGQHTNADALVGQAASVSAAAVVGWLAEKGIAVLVPAGMDSSLLAGLLQLPQGWSLMEDALQDNLEFEFWPMRRSTALHELLAQGASCQHDLRVHSFKECSLALLDLALRPAKELELVAVGPKGCSLYLAEGCDSPACAQPQFRAGGTRERQAYTLPVCQINGAQLPMQGRTLFLSMCMGPEYFDKFCGPFLASYRMVFGGIPAGWHTLRVWTVGVNASQLSRATEMFSAAGVEFEESSLEELSRRYKEEHAQGSGVEGYLHEDVNLPGVDSVTGCRDCDPMNGAECVCDPGVHDEKVVFNNIYFLKWVLAQFESTQGSGYQYMVFIDSDMLFLRPLQHFLPREPEVSDWDYAFTVYDRLHEVPWGPNEEVAQTKNGHARLNAGVQFFRYTQNVSQYLRSLVRITLDFVEQGHVQLLDGNPLAWFLEEFKGISQAAIAWAVGSQNLLYEDCQLCWPKSMSLDLLSEHLEPFSLKVQALPARLLNQAESVVDGVLTDDTCIVHLKGLWWRILILNSTAHPIDTRCLAWNSDAHKMWTSLYLAWRPEHVIDTVIRHGQGCSPSSWLDLPPEQQLSALAERAAAAAAAESA